MKPALRRLFCTTIVAVLQLHPAAAAVVSEDVPVPGGIAALAQSLGIEPTPDRGRFIYEITRLLYNTPEGRKPTAEAFLQAVRQALARGRRLDTDTRPAELVPVPLTADLWSNAIFHRKVAPRELVTAIIADRSAALLCLGLTTLDDGTLEYFADHPFLLERIYERSAPAFAAFAGSLRIQNNRVVPQGGDAAVALWESVVVEKMSRAERFLTQLFETGEGRLFYLYDVIGQLDPPRRAFALGLWTANATARADRFKAMTVALGAFREAHLKTLPFGRASFDVSMTLMRLQVAADGTPRPPASRGFWSRVFSGTDLPDDSARQLRNADDEPIDAAWLLETIGSADVRLRSERLDQIAFGQRLFGAADPGARADVFVAVRALSHYRMLMWTLERMSVRAPDLYAAAARRAARLNLLDGRRGFEAQAQFQGSLAILARVASVRTLPAARVQQLVEQLVALPMTDDGRYAGAMARWLRDGVAAAVPAAATTEAAILGAMSGGPSGDGPTAKRVVWEQIPYRLDLGAAERRRLQRVREKQEGVPLDVPLDLAAAARSLSAPTVGSEDLRSITDRLNALVGDIPRRVGHENEETSPPGVGAPPNAIEALRKIIQELTRDARAKDAKHAARVDALNELSDTLLAQVLLSIAYAADVGDPDGTVLLADDVSRRHDFGLGAKDSEMRQRVAWAVPRPEVNPGVPWHVSGSLTGLDAGLAPLALRRVNFERVLSAPKLTSNERDTFALSVSLLNPFAMRDADRDVIADAIARGRRRVAALGAADAAAFDRVADDLLLEGWRRRAVRWMLGHETDRVPSMFSFTELLALGGADPAALHSWGMSMLGQEGCLCSRLTPAGRWPTLLGRPPLGLTASAVADLNLYVAIMLRDLRLPAALAKVVLSGAMQDFIDEVRPTDDADWLTLARAARLVPRERIEDYVVAATAAGPLIPDSGRAASGVK